LRRIETFRRTRHGEAMPLAPRLPLGDGAPEPRGTRPGSCDFSTDDALSIDWAEAGFAPLLYGLALPIEGRLDEPALAAMRAYQPVRGGRLVLDGAPAIAGEWRLDAAPRFTGTGAFAGYVGRLRRPDGGRAAT